MVNLTDQKKPNQEFKPTFVQRKSSLNLPLMKIRKDRKLDSNFTPIEFKQQSNPLQNY